MENFIEENLSLLKTFDENKDKVIDEAEKQKAADTAREWAAMAKKGEGYWSYYGKEGRKPLKNWKEGEEIARKHPEVFLSQGDSPYWLPFKILSFAMEEE